MFHVTVDDDGIPRHDVRQRNDSDTATVRDRRRNFLGAVRRAIFDRAKPPAAIPRCALARDVRRSREPRTATRYVAPRAPNAAGAAEAFLRYRHGRRGAFASLGSGGPPCGASRARDGIWWRVGAR